MAYAHLTYVRFNMLEQLFVDLRVIPQMLGITDIPIKSSVKNINRYDWLKLIADLTLFRFSSIRDVTYHFVNQVLELKIGQYSLNIKSLKKQIGVSHPNVMDGLEQIENIGKELRASRNSRAHQGFISLYTEDDEMFKNISSLEEHFKTTSEYDLDAVYRKSSMELYNLIIEETKKILSAVINVVDNLVVDYEIKYEEKRINS